MQIEVLAIGSELLLGQIVDTNSARIGERLAASGIASYRQVRVGDNHGRIVAALREALGRSDGVIVCGGLGPTQDDITREAIAEVAGVDLVLDEGILAVIEDLFARRGRHMTANNLSQAMVPRGARTIAQRKGTAPGLIVEVGEKVIYALPGVPYELDDMLCVDVVPDLMRRSGDQGVIRSKIVRTWGLGESALAERLGGRVDALVDSATTTLAFLASGIEGIKVRITVKAASEQHASVLIDQEYRQVAEIVGDYIFGTDDETLESVTGNLLCARGWSLGVAESVTGGMMASRAVGVPGASKWFRGGVVAYATAVKRELLDVTAAKVVSEQAASELAVAAARLLGCEVAVATTGVAGPESQDGEEPGVVFIGLHTPSGTAVRKVHQLGDRERVRAYTVATAFDLVRLTLSGSPRGFGLRS